MRDHLQLFITLGLACSDSAVDTINALLADWPEGINRLDVDGRTPLMLVAGCPVRYSSSASAPVVTCCVDGLLAAGADVTAIDASGRNAIMLAAMAGNGGVVGRLTAAWPEGVNSRNQLGCTPLMYAESSGCLQALLAAGADTMAADTLGRTAMMFAANNQDETCLPLLLEVAKEGINQADNNGVTALMYAAANLCTGNVTLLVETGAVMHETDNAGKTALDHAIAYVTPEIEDDLREDNEADKHTIVVFLKTAMVAKELHDSIRLHRNAATVTPAAEATTPFLDIL